MNKYLIDSSIWIDYFNNKNPELNDVIDNFIDDNSVCYNGIILTEILHGANNEKEFNDLKNYFSGINYLDFDKNLFDFIALNSFKLKKEGIHIPLSDLIIASHCIKNDLILIDNDKHYRLLVSFLGLKRY